ncbi:MAG: hypothetical protein ABR562_05675 [Thermoplasmatota archaeon]
MAATITLDDANANRTRWGGFLFLAGLVLTTVGALLHNLTYPTGLPRADAAAADAIVANATVHAIMAWFGLAGAVLATVGAWFLVARHVASPFPGSAFWIAAGLGFLALVAVHAFRATGYATLAANATAEPILFGAARSTVLLAGTVGWTLVYGGLLGVFWGESRAHASVVPNSLATAVALCCGLGVAAQLLSLFSATSAAAIVLGYAIYPSTALLLPFLLKVAWPGISFVWSQPRAEAEADA